MRHTRYFERSICSKGLGCGEVKNFIPPWHWLVLFQTKSLFRKVIITKTCLQWHAGNLLCKVLMMIRTGGYILSSLLLVVLSIDR